MSSCFADRKPVPRLRKLLPPGLVLVGVLACRGAVDPPREPHVEAVRPGETCARSSFAIGETCVRRDVPASNASSPEGCKSDAECKAGMNGRCVKTGADDPSGHAAARDGIRHGNLFGAAPPPPPRTVCIYDQCFNDGDCGAKSRCVCGTEGERNTCRPVDDCTTDAACGANRLCQCNSSAGGANYCIQGNCRTDADCHDGFKCESGIGGTFCRTPNDLCTTSIACPNIPNASNACGYLVEHARWECQAIPFPPPG